MKDKIVLINLPPAPDYDYGNRGEVYPATGILLVGTIMKASGFRVRVIDGTLSREYKKDSVEAIDKDTAVVGFSVMTSQVPAALDISAEIKEKYPDVLVVWGGIHPILFPKQTADSIYVDIVVTGDGYETTLGLIDFLRGKIGISGIKGIGYKDPAGKVVFTQKSPADNISILPHIDYEILDDVETYLKAESVYAREVATDDKKPVRIMPILTGLGCCYKCQFCINVFLGRKYRFRPAASIVEEIKRLQQKYKANAFVFYDEDFLISKSRFLEFLQLVESQGLRFYWRIWSRVNYFRDNYLNKDTILKAEALGLRSIAMGAESGSQKVLDLISKDIELASISNSAALLNGTKITARYSFIIGLEGEEKKDLLSTYRLCLDLIRINKRVDIAGPFIFRFYPGSPIFNRIAEKYNIAMPARLEQWKELLSDEGYVKTDKMPWTFRGFAEIADFFDKELYLFSRIRHSDSPIAGAIRKLIDWRIKNLYTVLPLELYLFDAVRHLRHTLKRGACHG